MDKNYLKAKQIVDDVLSDFCIDFSSVEEKLKEDCGFDSLTIVDVIVELEGSLGVEFDDGELDPSKLICIDDLIKLVRNYL